MLAELRAISNKSSTSRFERQEKKVVSTTAPTEGDAVSSNGVDFLKSNPEDPVLNQYWYSQASVEAIAKECKCLMDSPRSGSNNFTVAFLSTPSIYFALDEAHRQNCFVFDYDKKWEDDRGFVFYDFNKPLDFDIGLRNSFDLVVIDPPFITREVWEKYSETAVALLKEPPAFDSKSGMVIGTTLQENAPFLQELLSCRPQKFKPSIPNLPYQYNSYANFSGAKFLGQTNAEIGE